MIPVITVPVSNARESPAVLAFRSVTKAYGRVPLLDQVSFQVDEGTFFGLVGMNGAGKTTLIKCLLDINRVDSGEILIQGSRSTLTAARHCLAFVPERFMAPFYLTGGDFLRLMAKLYGHPHREEHVADILGRLDLDREALGKAVRTYSKGMTQKLGLAACLLSNRPLMVLDEPTSGLDPKARACLKAVLKERNAAGTTIFLTSHALADVEEMCDKIAILHRGRLRFAGTTDALRLGTGAATLEQAFLDTIEA